MKRNTAIITAVAALSTTAAFVGAGIAHASEELAKKSGCLTCHNVTGAKKMGPSFKDAAGKGEAAILAALNDSKKHGMVKASDDDKKALAKWIAGMK
jgi:cytochrome c551/c552